MGAQGAALMTLSEPSCCCCQDRQSACTSSNTGGACTCGSGCSCSCCQSPAPTSRQCSCTGGGPCRCSGCASGDRSNCTCSPASSTAGSGGPARAGCSGGSCAGQAGKPVAVHVSHMPALPAKVVSVSGAGDCLVGGMLSCLTAAANGLQLLASSQGAIHGPSSTPWSSLGGWPPLDLAEQSLALGMAAAHAAVESPLNTPDLVLHQLLGSAHQALGGLQRWQVVVDNVI
jgi:hypothetical protein